MNNKRLKAFTLLEMTIAMLLAAILIMLTYVSYSIVLRTHHAFAHKNEDLVVLTTLDYLLSRDFQQAASIMQSKDSIVFFKPSQVVSYQFSVDYIVRQSTKIDTFKVKASTVSLTFENQPLNEDGEVDELTFVLLYQQQEIPYHYHKIYSSENLIEKIPHAIY